ncbi:MAG TPA: histidine kinase [Spirochaetia bacterium]|nr:histidine kinase [Spirochaetales bacterium]HRS64780.1 histidine kinase [Spirochaetia bacterium]HOT59304.1 histidine kinase [Spirochaetales bacterium]HPD79446.1 histidine kinase [Spirochaetales bacterium]HQK33145.1 histidine kinase [Spirochaetales bacterium]
MKAKIRNRITLNSLVILIILITATTFTSILSLELTHGIGLLLKNNNTLKSIRDSLDNTHKHLETYLTFKNSESLKEYIKWSSTLESLIPSLNNRIYNDKLLLMERNLYSVLTQYLKTTSTAVNAKRGRNIPVYTAEFEHAVSMVESAHTILDTLHLKNMNRSLYAFDFFKEKFGEIVFINFTLIAIAFVLSILIIYRYSFAITVPITLLAQSARELEIGNFIHSIPQYAHDDEIGTLYTAFNNMQKSIKDAFEAIQKKSELEQQVLVQKMEMLEFQHKLKDSELLALQTQINPHFLYNTLSAGWQLALAEHDERTAEFLQKLAEFIRYALKPANRLVLVSEEVDCAKNMSGY